MLASLAQSTSPSSAGLPLFIPMLIAVGLGFIPANIAKKKGYSAGGFYVFGVLFFLVAVIVALCLKDKTLASSAVPAGRAAIDPGITWTHTGVRYMLGYTAQSPSYGIWDRQNPGPATAKFPFTEEGKAEALARFQQLEPQGQVAGQAAMPPPPPPAPTGGATAWAAGPTR